MEGRRLRGGRALKRRLTRQRDLRARGVRGGRFRLGLEVLDRVVWTE